MAGASGRVPASSRTAPGPALRRTGDGPGLERADEASHSEVLLLTPDEELLGVGDGPGGTERPGESEQTIHDQHGTEGR